MKRLYLLIVASLLLPIYSQASDELGGAWIGGLYGGQGATWGSTISPTSYGGTLGIKFGGTGLGVSYITGSKDTTINGVTVKSSSTLITGILAFFPVGMRILYFGPMAGHSVFKVGASAKGKTVVLSDSGFMGGIGAGLNIPIGFATIGVDGGYLIGTDSKSLAFYLGSLKLWF